MVVSAFQDRLTTAFPPATWAPLVQGLTNGICNADELIASTPMLRHILGRDLRGQIRRVGILTALESMCRRGELPFGAEPAKMPKGSWHWLDIKSDRFVAHVARTVSAGALPDDTPNRQALCLRNEYDLFDDGVIPSVESVLSEVGVRYSYVTFGAEPSGKLTHACVGMPSSDDTEWLAFVNILRRAAPSAAVAPPAPRQPDPSDQLKLRRSVEEMLEAKRDDNEKLA